MLGVFQVVQGLVALVEDDCFPVTQSGLVVDVGYTVWGWTHLALGLIAGLAGIGLLVATPWRASSVSPSRPSAHR